MPTLRLTTRAVEAVQTEEGRTQTDFVDTSVAGLVLRVGAGGTKAWSLVYSHPITGRRARVKIGRFPEVTLAEARERAVVLKAEIARGNIPVRRTRQAEAPRTVEELFELYATRRLPDLASCDDVSSRLRRYVLPQIGQVALSSLAKADVIRVMDGAAELGKPTTALRIFEDLRALINFGLERDLINRSPMSGLRPPPRPPARERVLSIDELACVWARLPNAPMSGAMVTIVRLLMLTACRAGEVAGLRREEVDLPNAVWMISAGRTKNRIRHTVPLSPMALEVLRPALEATVAGPVFPNPRNAHLSIDAHAVSTAVRRSQEVIGISHWRAHDIRRSVATGLGRAGTPPVVIAHLLNHVTGTGRGTVTARYATYDYHAEKRAALENWSALLAAGVADKEGAH